MIARRATSAEIIKRFGDRRASFRHFVKEFLDHRTANGVAHRQRTSARVWDVDGVPHVKQAGVLEPLTATHYTLDTGAEFLADLRLDSEYLPARAVEV